MTRDFSLDCASLTFRQGSRQYLAQDSALLGASAPRPVAVIETASGEEMIKAAVCEGRPIESAVVEGTRESAMTGARSRVTPAQ